jgi:hypothetical protein
MITTTLLLYTGVVVAAGSLAAGYGLGGSWSWAGLWVILALLWLIEQRPAGLPGTGTLALVVYVSAAAAGYLAGFPTALMLLVVVAALSAWDLDRFRRRLAAVKPAGEQGLMERRHLVKLAAVASLGTLLAGFGFLIQIQFSFGVIAMLTLLIVFTLSRMAAALRAGKSLER